MNVKQVAIRINKQYKEQGKQMPCQIYRECKSCGTGMFVPVGSKAKFCYDCKHDAQHNKEVQEKRSATRRSHSHSRYCMTLDKNGKTVYLHRMIMEELIGRPLEKYEVVHHIDGNKKNNDISNLMLMTISEHNKLHALLRKGV